MVPPLPVTGIQRLVNSILPSKIIFFKILDYFVTYFGDIRKI
ncbi:hypothetical protein CHY_2480 [Carboxydothermus hydrogenoformans Z-2901]|uniref:Uncharacterized protein n=1 Tax=Carboxydothermus hydrogenoformans (strain ATCC BAA-161 / DSM 6008 / Z-2901) TaxID=246194 RepID=Q3A9B0_CARHZ|nr:hypothetical protein CHY_2480 [Carboxydothermus hydrogenoformans Z-2901]